MCRVRPVAYRDTSEITVVYARRPTVNACPVEVSPASV